MWVAIKFDHNHNTDLRLTHDVENGGNNDRA
jgi:hypothetical protein